jgi:hypothetical protein
LNIGLSAHARPTTVAGRAIGPLHPAFADDARALVLTELFGTPYSDTVLGALEHAILGGNMEYCVIQEIIDGELTGVALFGHIAGTSGTSRILFVAAGSRKLIEAVTARGNDTRLVIAELPDDRPFDRMRKLLEECGFHEESRIPDLYRPGVAMTFLRFPLIPQERV